MKRSVLLSTICLLALLGCATYTGIKPIYPEVRNPNYPPKEVDSLTPTLRWDPWSDPNVTYDLIIYEGITGGSIWTGFTRLAGREVYYREGLQETVHEIEKPLKPDTRYLWSVRVRSRQKVSHWARYHFGGFKNQYFVFDTPKEESKQEQGVEVKTPIMH